MTTKKQREVSEGKRQPKLSAVEWTAIVIYLEHELVAAQKQLGVWRDSYRKSQNAATAGGVKFHEVSVKSLKGAVGRAKQALEHGVSTGKLPAVAQTPYTVLERNGRV